MAIIVCPGCRREITDRLYACHHCNYVIGGDLGPKPVDEAENPTMRMILPIGRSGWAIAAGYLGLISVVMVPAPLAVITALLAFREMKLNPKKRGMGRAIFGLVMGLLGTVGLIFMIFAESKSPRRW